MTLVITHGHGHGRTNELPLPPVTAMGQGRAHARRHRGPASRGSAHGHRGGLGGLGTLKSCSYEDESLREMI
jgi:hypothetical protein